LDSSCAAKGSSVASNVFGVRLLYSFMFEAFKVLLFGLNVGRSWYEVVRVGNSFTFI